MREEEGVMSSVKKGREKENQFSVLYFLFILLLGWNETKENLPLSSGVTCVWFKRVFMNLYPLVLLHCKCTKNYINKMIFYIYYFC